MLKKGKRFSGKFFLVKYNYNRGQESRFAIIVSKKVSPSAVARNRLRRQIMAAIRLNLHLIQSPLNCILIAHPQVLNCKSAEITAAIIHFFLNHQK